MENAVVINVRFLIFLKLRNGFVDCISDDISFQGNSKSEKWSNKIVED